MAYPSHATTDVVGDFRISSYSNASTSMIVASCDGGGLEGSRSTIAECGLGSRSTIAECGLGISATADGILTSWLANTLYTFMSNSFNDI